MTLRHPLFLICFLALWLAPIAGQEGEEAGSVPLADEAPAEDEVHAAGRDAEPEGTVDTGLSGVPEPAMNEETLVRDIETAGFYELVDWLQSLGLATSGDRDTLSRRLLEHYGLAGSVPTEEGETPLVVDSAARTRYFRLSDIEERYVRLSGGVTLTLRDEERGVLHQIVADEVTYNQDLSILSASGNVVYTLDRQGTVEQFTGAALTVQLDDWEGAFVRGVTQRARTIEGEEIDFSFEGSYITRSGDDVVVMDDGRVTSSVADPPNYEIRAEKIWVLAPGEWGLRNAFFYVGRVPVFYFPFFFRPGNELFFNPSIGSREREGRFIQTTTYLIGEPEEPDSAFSFLQIADEDGDDGATRIEGLYLVPDESADPEEAAGDAELRLLADVYTKLGAYAALDGSFPEAGPFSDLELYIGLAASRHIRLYNEYSGRAATYSPYFIYDGEPLTSWNVSQLGSVRLPFRFGLGLQAALRGSAGSLQGDITYFSDSRFRRDFDQRSEQIDWLGLVGQGTPTATPDLVGSFDWTLRAEYTPVREDPAPWLQRVQLQDISATLRWREKDITIPEEDPDPSSVTREDFIRDADASPETSFFHPDVLQSPNISALVSGELLNLSSSKATDVEVTEPSEVPIRPPWDETETLSREPDEELRLPAVVAAIPAPPIPELWSASLRYSLSPGGVVENFFNEQLWSSPADIDFGIRHSAASGRVVGSLPLAVNLLSNSVGLNGTLSTTGQYRGLFNRAAGVDDAEWDQLRQEALSYSSASATGNFGARLTPFPSSALWSGSTVNYTLNLLLYQLSYQGGDPDNLPTHLPARWFEWDEEFIPSHQLQMSAVLDLLAGTQSVQLTAQLPPKTPEFTGRMNLAYDPLTVSLGSGVFQEEDDPETPEDERTWSFQPVTSVQTLSLGETGQIKNQLSYDVEAEELAYNTIAATVGPFKGDLELRTADGFIFGGADVGWVPDSSRRLRPTRTQLSATLDAEPEPLWRNRLQLSGSAVTSWSMNLLKYTESRLSFGWDAHVQISDFLDLSVSSRSTNNQTYVYLGPLAEGVGRPRKSLIADLLRSFNFFSRSDREDSAFNLEQIRIDATHYLEDWDLTVAYAGRPEVVEFTEYLIENPEDPGEFIRVDPGTAGAEERNFRRFEWQSTLTIELSWRAIRELSSNVRANNQRSSATVVDDRDETLGWDDWDITFGSDS